MSRHDFNRRLDDQALILQGIRQVKAELEKQHAENPEDWLTLGHILLRLQNLYSLLDVDKLAELVDQENNRRALDLESA